MFMQIMFKQVEMNNNILIVDFITLYTYNKKNGYAEIGRQVPLRTGWNNSYKFESYYPYIYM